MNPVSKQEVDLEKLVIYGDLSTLSPDQKVMYYIQRCKEHGLNPASKPFEYIRLNGKEVLYATKGCAEQLRAVHKISIKITKADKQDDLFVVIAEAKDGTGREDSATGAVSISGLKGEALANAVMKAETKAKRRVTLSLCGLNMLDETEAESVRQLEGRVLPGQPEPGDGIEDTSYKIPFGKYAKRTLEEVGPADLTSYVNYLMNKAQKDGKEITGIVGDFIDRASEFIGAMENRAINEMRGIAQDSNPPEEFESFR